VSSQKYHKIIKTDTANNSQAETLGKTVMVQKKPYYIRNTYTDRYRQLFRHKENNQKDKTTNGEHLRIKQES